MRLSTAELDNMVAKAIVDAYGVVDRLALPFATVVLGVTLTAPLPQREGSSQVQGRSG
jgi:hypothetical protein